MKEETPMGSKLGEIGYYQFKRTGQKSYVVKIDEKKLIAATQEWVRKNIRGAFQALRENMRNGG
jgi:hypothetical protein